MPPSSARPLVVLESFPRPLPTTNPYLIQLQRGLGQLPDVQVLNFSWRTALRGRYDIFHVHWPEALFDGRSWLTRTAHDLVFLLLLLRIRVLRIPLVRTVHNLGRPTGLRPLENLLLALTDRWTDLRIRLNSLTKIPPDQQVATILHGHYRDWFAPFPSAQMVPGRVVFFGLVRRYKGVDHLIRAFRQVPMDSPTTGLIIAGQPSTPELAAELQRLADADPRISFDLRFLDDGELTLAVGSAELVVLPYLEMHNSGGALTALSLNRPVLVPDNAVNNELAREVGQGWVHTYTNALTADRLVEVLAGLRADPPAGAPDLSAREWRSAGADHLAAFKRALLIRRSARRG